MPQEDKPEVHMGNMGFGHIQCELELAFQKGTTGFTHFLRMRPSPFHD
jgi:hypothetical protein